MGRSAGLSALPPSGAADGLPLGHGDRAAPAVLGGCRPSATSALPRGTRRPSAVARLGLCGGDSSRGDRRGTAVVTLTSDVESHSSRGPYPGGGRGAASPAGRGRAVSPGSGAEGPVCSPRRRQEAGEQLARAAGLGDGAREARGGPAPPGPQGPAALQQRQQLRVRVPRGQPRQRRGAAAGGPGSEDTQPWGPAPTAASRGLVRAPPGQSAPPREPGRPAAAEAEEIF